jgi:site-specific DNA-methyltransferase (adenine-specific)
LGRNVICVDQSRGYVDEINRRCQEIANDNEANFQAVVGNSRNLSFIEDNSVGLIVTSPPYWNKANYGDNQDNIGNQDNYADFLSSIEPIFQECYRVLMPGRKICVVTANVNQHTNHGLVTFPVAMDFGVILRKIGYYMVNEVIWSKDGTGGRWGSANGQRPIFGSYPYPPNFLFKNVHEYILIFAKPDKKKVTGPKVRDYNELYRLEE